MRGTALCAARFRLFYRRLPLAFDDILWRISGRDSFGLDTDKSQTTVADNRI